MLSMNYGVMGVILLLGWVGFTYNRLVQDRNRTHSAWSDVEVQLKRRYDLIPKLVDVVKGYGQYEKSTLENITQLRAQSEQVHDPALRTQIEQHINQHLGQLVLVA